MKPLFMGSMEGNKKFIILTAITVIFSFILPVVGTLFANKYLTQWFWIGESFHALIEGIGAFSAIMLTLLLLMMRFEEKTSYRLWVACALLAMGILDGFHASVPPGESSIWLRSTSTFFGGALFALVWFPVNRRILKAPEVLIWVVLIGTSVFDGFSVLSPSSIPNMEINGQFALTAKIINFIGGLLFLVAAAYFVIRFKMSGQNEDLMFFNLCLLFGMAGLLFHMSTTWHASWWFWHFLRLMAYLHILGYVITLYQKRKESLQKEFHDLEIKVKERTEALVKVNRKLQLSEHRLRKIMYSNTDSLVIVSASGVVSFINPAAKALLDCETDEILGQKFDFPVNPGEISQLEIVQKNGEKAIAEMRVVEIDWGGETCNLIYLRNITETIHLKEKVRSMLLIDELTDLYNRRGFLMLAEQQLKIASRTKRVMLLILFKIGNLDWINENMGNETGDRALNDAAKILKQTFRDIDIISRLEGNKFAVLVIEASRTSMDSISKRLKENIEKLHSKKSQQFHLTIEVIASFYNPGEDQTIEELISFVDKPVYQEKDKKVEQEV